MITAARSPSRARRRISSTSSDTRTSYPPFLASTVWMNFTLMGSSSTRRIRLDMKASVHPAYRHLGVSAKFLLCFQTIQEIIRHLKATPPAAESQARFVGAVVVAATGDDHGKTLGQ